MTHTTRRPIRVLNALWHLGIGGIEKSLVEVLRRLDRERFQMDFLVTSQWENHYDSTVKELGARIILSRQSLSPWRTRRELAAINRRYGPYDVLHSHRHYSGAPILSAAHSLGIGVRVAQSHAIRAGEGSALERAGFACARYLIRKHVTHGLAVSRAAASSLFGQRWESDPRVEVIPLGSNFEPFRASASRLEVRRELNIGDDELALVHVGRFVPSKNHQFIVAVAKALCRLTPRVRIVLIGDGPLLQPIQHLVSREGLADRVMLLGARSNVPELLLAMDAFIFPSIVEALGAAAMEAQAAGLVSFLSDRVVPEVDIVPELLHRLPLEAGPAAWANVILANCPAQLSQHRALEKCLASPFNIETYVKQHERIYASALDD